MVSDARGDPADKSSVASRSHARRAPGASCADGESLPTWQRAVDSAARAGIMLVAATWETVYPAALLAMHFAPPAYVVET